MMSSTNEEDPFLQVQQDVQSQLTYTRQLFTSYLRIRSLAATSRTAAPRGAPNPELGAALSDLEAALSSLSEDVADLSGAVSALESEPGRFGVGPGELAVRKRAVGEARGEIEDMRAQLRAAAASDGHDGGALPDPSSFALDDHGGGGDDDDHYAEFEHRQQEQMLRDQDVQLDGVFQTVGTLRRQASDMGRELEEQSGMLDVVDDMADRVGGRLQAGMKRLKHVARSNEDTLSSCCIGVLILVLVILLVLLLIL